MPPRTRAASRRAAGAAHRAPDLDGEGSGSSSDASIPASTASPNRTKPDGGPTLRPRSYVAEPTRAAATQQRKHKRQRTDDGGIAAGDGGVAPRSAGVNHAALDAINAFSRKKRGAVSEGRALVEVQIPSTSRSILARGGTELDAHPDGHEAGPRFTEQQRRAQDLGSPELSASPHHRLTAPPGQHQTEPGPGVAPGPSVTAIEVGHVTESLHRASPSPQAARKARRGDEPLAPKPAYRGRAASQPISEAAHTVRTEATPLEPATPSLHDDRQSTSEPQPGWEMPGSAEQLEQTKENRSSSGTGADRLSASPGMQQPVDVAVAQHGPSRSPPPRGAAPSAAPGLSDESVFTAQLNSKALRSMRRLLGGRAWTGLGHDWVSEITDPLTHGRPSVPMSHNAPARTRLGRKYWEDLFHMQELFRSAPRAPAFAAQHEWLSGMRTQVDAAFRSIDTLTTEISEQHLAVVGDAALPASDGMDMRVALVKDLAEYIIPLAVSVQHSIFLLGSAEDEDEDGKSALPDEGRFTRCTLDCLAKTVGWVVRLERALSEELQRRPLDAPPASETSDGEGGDRKAARAGRASAKAALRERRRLRLGKHIAQLRGSVARAFAELEYEETGAERRKRAAERAKRGRQARLAEESAEQEERLRRWEAMCRSTQEMRRDLDPLRGKWREVVVVSPGPDGRDPASRETTASRAVRTSGADRHGTAPARVGSPPQNRPRGGQHRPRQPPTAAARRPPWSDADSRLLLGRLRSLDANHPDWEERLRAWARAFDRSDEDVRREIRVLRAAWRSLARERGVAIEPWARREAGPHRMEGAGPTRY